MGDVFNAYKRAHSERTIEVPVADSDEKPANLLGKIDHSDLLEDAAKQNLPSLRNVMQGAVADQYRAVRYQILARAHEHRMQTHLIVSHGAKEGRSTTATNLALAFSELRNGRALLIEADLRRPALGKLFDRPMRPGLRQLLTGELDEIDEAIHRTTHRGLHVMPAGTRGCSDAARLLTSPRLAMTIERGKDLYDHVIVDVPPISVWPDAIMIAPHTDHALIVARLSHTPASAVERAKKLLGEHRCDVAGVVLTHDRGLA